MAVLNFIFHQAITSDCGSHVLPSGCTDVSNDSSVDRWGRLCDASLSSPTHFHPLSPHSQTCLSLPFLPASWPSRARHQLSSAAILSRHHLLNMSCTSCFQVLYRLITSYSSSKRTLKVKFHLFSHPSLILLDHDNSSPLNIDGRLYLLLFVVNHLP